MTDASGPHAARPPPKRGTPRSGGIYGTSSLCVLAATCRHVQDEGRGRICRLSAPPIPAVAMMSCSSCSSPTDATKGTYLLG